MPVVNGKKYPYTAAGKAAAKKAATGKAKPKATPKPKKTSRAVPPDYDVIIPGFNDPKTIRKYSDLFKTKKK